MQKLLFVVGAIALMSIAAHMMMKESSKSLAIEESFIEYSDESLMEWIVWKEEHSKYYSDIKEEGYRLNVWMSNKRYIEENQGDTYSLGLNHFSDLTNEEWRALYLMNKGIIKNFHEEKTSSDKALPENFTAPTSVDWVTEGKTIQVLNQGQCGSCWAFSTVESIDSAFAVTKGGAVPNLSEQQVVSCAGTAYGEYGCNGGNVVPAYKYVQAHPLATAAQYPYVSGTGQTGQCDTAKQSLGSYQITGYKTIPSNNCDSLMNALALTPISVCVDAANWQNYKTGIFSNCGTSLDHCVLAVGYLQNQYWVIQNSWTTSWGQKGMMQLKWGNTCGVCKEAQYPTV